MTLKETCDKLTQLIFEHEFKRLRSAELQLIRDNHNCGGSSDGFRHQGKIFTNLETKLISRGKFSSVESSMIPAVNLYMQDASTVSFEKMRVHQALAILLKDTRTKQDIRDALPECAVEILSLGKDCPRTRPEAYTLSDNPRSYNQYTQIREKIEFYLASKLLY